MPPKKMEAENQRSANTRRSNFSGSPSQEASSSSSDPFLTSKVISGSPKSGAAAQASSGGPKPAPPTIKAHQRFSLNPFEKMIRYRRVPCKFLLNVIIFILLCVNILHFQLQRAIADYEHKRELEHLFLPEDYVEPQASFYMSNFLPTYQLITLNQVEEVLRQSVSTYYRLAKESPGLSYLFALDIAEYFKRRAGGGENFGFPFPPEWAAAQNNMTTVIDPSWIADVLDGIINPEDLYTQGKSHSFKNLSSLEQSLIIIAPPIMTVHLYPINLRFDADGIQQVSDERPTLTLALTEENPLGVFHEKYQGGQNHAADGLGGNSSSLRQQILCAPRLDTFSGDWFSPCVYNATRGIMHIRDRIESVTISMSIRSVRLKDPTTGNVAIYHWDIQEHFAFITQNHVTLTISVHGDLKQAFSGFTWGILVALSLVLFCIWDAILRVRIIFRYYKWKRENWRLFDQGQIERRKMLKKKKSNNILSASQSLSLPKKNKTTGGYSTMEEDLTMGFLTEKIADNDGENSQHKENKKEMMGSSEKMGRDKAAEAEEELDSLSHFSSKKTTTVQQRSEEVVAHTNEAQDKEEGEGVDSLSSSSTDDDDGDEIQSPQLSPSASAILVSPRTLQLQQSAGSLSPPQQGSLQLEPTFSLEESVSGSIQPQQQPSVSPKIALPTVRREKKRINRYTMGWRWVIWALIADGLAIISTVMNLAEGLNVNESLEFVMWRNMILGLAALCSSILFISYFRHVPKFYFLMEAMYHALPYLGLFLVNVAPIFFGFSIFGLVVFGWYAPMFSNWGYAFVTLISLMGGDSPLWVFTSISATDWTLLKVVGRFYVMLFLCLFIYCALNITLAIVQNSYYQIKKKLRILQDYAKDLQKRYAKLQNKIQEYEDAKRKVAQLNESTSIDAEGASEGHFVVLGEAKSANKQTTTTTSTVANNINSEQQNIVGPPDANSGGGEVVLGSGVVDTSSHFHFADLLPRDNDGEVGMEEIADVVLQDQRHNKEKHQRKKATSMALNSTSSAAATMHPSSAASKQHRDKRSSTVTSKEEGALPNKKTNDEVNTLTMSVDGGQNTKRLEAKSASMSKEEIERNIQELLTALESIPDASE